MAEKQWVTIEYFEDTHDEGTAYEAGTVFPREGVEVTPERIEELSTKKNKRQRPAIVELKELAPKPSEKDLLDAKTVPELKKLADDKKLEYDSKTTKDQLVALLLEK